MITPGGISDSFTESDDLESKRGRSSLVKIVSILTALVITAALFIGFMIWRQRHESRVAVEPQAKSNTAAARPALPLKAQVYLDEPVRKGSQAIISGTVHNISGEPLSNLSVEVELARRKEATSEVRALEVEPRELAPDAKGRYTLTLTGDYRSVKLLHIKSGAESNLIGFKTAPGAARPVERAPEGKTIIVDRPSGPRQGEEFINTPDNPARIP